MNKHPVFFSIIVPAYNRARMIPKCVASVLGQKFTDWELIIVDDGSSDDTKEVVANIRDERVRYIYQDNKERSAARNNGIRNAKGTYICFLDSDDEYLPDYLEVLHNAIREKDFKVAAFKTFARMIAEDGKQSLQVVTEIAPGQKAIDYLILNTSFLPNLCLHHAITEKIKFNEQFSFAEDTDFTARVFAAFPLFVIAAHTTAIHFHPGNSQAGDMEKIHPAYIATFKHMLSDKKLEGHFDTALLKRSISKRYWWLALQQLNVHKKGEARRSLRQSVKFDKGKLLTFATYKVLLRSLF